jgi:predicted extracellular nuclease
MIKTSSPLQRLLSLAVVLALLLAGLPFTAPAAQAATAELFFSEYIEGTSNNKALEIYNGTGAAVDLAAGGYNVFMSFNGGTGTLTINLTGTVADGDVYVLAQSSANATILAQADQTNGAGWFNGDDAVVLRKGTTIIDAFGQVGFDPGAEWGTGLVSTADNTLRRKADICSGDSDGSNTFDPSLEWDGFALDTFDGLGVHTANCGVVVVPDPKLNEFSASTVGTDVEYVEIFGDPNTDYSAYTVLEIEGDLSGTATGTVDEAISVGTTGANGIWFTNLPANALENGTITLLVVKDFTGALNSDLDTDDDGAFDSMPWSALVDAVAVNDGGAGDLTYGAPVLGVSYDGQAFAPGGASRFPDGTDTEAATDWVRNDFDLAGIPGFTGTIVEGEAYNTPGATNAVFVPPPFDPGVCSDPFTPIFEVQGSGPTSPEAGNLVSVEGVVVGDFQNNASPDSGDLNGFHVQDPTGDGNPATSDGIFVFAPGGIDVAVGDAVRASGLVSEFNGMTEITANQILVCSTGSVAPTPVTLPVATVDAFEAYEGMLVTFPQALIISEYFNFDRFNEIVLTSERHLTPTAEFEPGSPEQQQAVQDFLLDRITLDDGRTPQNPDPAIHPNGGIFDLSNLFRGGDTVANVTGVIDFSFGLYRIQPTQGADYANANPRTAQPDEVGGNLKVASFNVLNYFDTLTSAGNVCGPNNEPCRGADTALEFTRQRDKIIAALVAIDADIAGLIEIENDQGDATANLVDGLNAVMGAGTYAYIDTGFIGTDVIKQAFIYKPASVTPVGAYAILDSSVDPRFLDDQNRPVLAQTFMQKNTGGIVTVAVNHLKSKGSDCNAIGDPDTGDGSGNCNLTRLAAAQALVDWLASDPTGSGDSDFLIIGDLNSYDKEAPIDAIRAGADDILGTADDYTDLVFQFQGEAAYSYVFDGQTGYLDHALASASLVGEVTGTTVWHINADEPDLIDYDMTFKQDAQDAIYSPDPYRSSDHDPVIVGLNACDEIAPTLSVTVTPDMLWPPNHKYVEVQATVTASDNFDPNPTVTLVSVTSNEPDNGEDDGNTVNDIVIVDQDTFKLRAERSGIGSGRVYTITYMVTDACGNTAQATATVTVPISLGD